MSNNKIRIAITQGDTEGKAYEQIFSIFSEPEMFDICTPIIYGSPKVAAAQSKALHSECQFTIIKSVSDAHDGKLNIIQRTDEEALADVKEGLVDVLTYCVKDETKFSAEGMNILPIYMNGVVRMAFAQDSTSENITEKATTLQTILKRDYRLSDPRIALLADDAEGTEVFASAIKELAEKGVKVFGLYQTGTFFDEREYVAFDAVLATNAEQAMPQMKNLSNNGCTIALANQSVVSTMLDEGGYLCDAIYTAIDIFRHQKEYDAPMGNPLPKLYHEHPDNGEKLRFSIPKKKSEE